MPKTKRDIFKRYCDQMITHIEWIQKHLKKVYAPYQNRRNTHAYLIMTNIETELIQIKDEIIRLRKLL